MTGTRERIDESWAVIEGLGSRDGYSSRVLPEFETTHGPVLLAADSDGTRHVLVPIDRDDEVKTDRRSQGVQLLRRRLVDTGRTRVFIDIRCPKPSLYRVFNQIAASMLDQLMVSDLSPAKLCARVLESWRALIRQAERPVSKSVLLGAFGELSELLELSRLSSEAAQLWTGPTGEPQDFISAHGAIEVKTSARSPAKRVTINGIDQLDGAGRAFLLLVVQEVKDEATGDSISDQLDQLRDMGAPTELVLDRLSLLGLAELDAPAVAESKFALLRTTAYRVDEQFPRLVPSALRAPLNPSISRVSYELDLEVAKATSLPPAELGRFRRQLVGAS